MLNCASVNTMYPAAGNRVSSGIRNFQGTAESSVRNQPPMFTSLAVGLCSSMASTTGGSECVSTSLIRLEGIKGVGSSAPGEPPGRVLARQLERLLGFSLALGVLVTSENPYPSGVNGQRPLFL